MRCIASHLVAAMLLAGSVVAGTAVAASPVKIAVFPFELMDFSAAAPLRRRLTTSTASNCGFRRKKPGG